MPAKFSQRSFEKELLDEPYIPKALLFQNLRELDVVNRTLGGNSVSIKGIKKLVKDKTKIYTIADIGCGGGDILIHIARWARKNHFQVQLIGVDINTDAVDYVKANSEKYPEITAIACTYQDFFKNGHQVDIVHCSLFCHHLNDVELTELLRQVKQHAATGFIINDLHRHWFAYYSIKFLTRLLNGSSLVKNDAPLSVLRGFKKAELQAFVSAAGIMNAKIKWKWAFRYLVLSGS